MLEVILKKGEEEAILKGFSWIYNNEVLSFNGPIKSGEICKVKAHDNKFVGYGFFNSASKLMVRMLTLKDETIDYNFFYKRIKEAITLRETLAFKNATRLIFSEADFLPGLVVDKYNDILVCQFSVLGMYLLKDMIKDILVSIVKPRGIYYRNDLKVNEIEGIPLEKGYLYNEFPTKLIIEENGLKLYVDIEDGQKTGYFLDQKLNRDYLKYYVKDKVVLDCFSHTGGFSLNALKNGCKKVVACDISEHATDFIKENIMLNGFSNFEVVTKDVFLLLEDEKYKNYFDVIILDPPAFTKSKETVKSAYKGYFNINYKALQILKNGGYLFTFSCSQHMTTDLFLNMLRDVEVKLNRKLQMLDFRIQAPDHPTLLQSQNELYLKCVVLRVIDY